ncbi:UPF0489 family protein [Lacrimispora amygdalina]|uniref:UPF0489 family protein n=1 Tax=Lacrimispora amygdalina TaxID=253257 RepID=UPI000BE27998|nr:UPF0489 family protein [Lacrimispora amygdalina]
MKKIMTIICEEHHEAFYIWNHAIKNKWIMEKGNFLLHIDEHPDMGTPCFNTSIHQTIGNIPETKKFTYKELNIACFIVPSVYLGIIEQIYWVNHINKNLSTNKRFVYSYQNDGRILISGNASNMENKIKPESYTEFVCYAGLIEHIFPRDNLILDIDLDYFSCSGDPKQLGCVRVEITKNEYDGFMNNKYHPVNYINLPRIDAIKQDERYFYIINDFQVTLPNTLKVQENEIMTRIHTLVETLKEKKITPSLVNICRSSHSRFTPIDQVDYIQENLMKALSEIYQLDVINFKEL